MSDKNGDTLTWQRVVQTIAFRLLDRGQGHTLVLLGVIGLLGIIALRMPSDGFLLGMNTAQALAKNENYIIAALFGLCTIFATLSCLLFAAMMVMKQRYRNELDRMATYKRELETALDPKRLPTYGSKKP